MRQQVNTRDAVNGGCSVDVIIPSYKPDRKFSRLLAMLGRQSVPIRKILVMNTERSYWNEEGYKGIPNLEVHHVEKKDFDHGGTRNLGASYSTADLMVFMTQDAVPADEFLIEKLTAPFHGNEKVAVSYGRQLADKDCGFIETYTRSFNYPEEDRIKDLDDLEELGIKTFFCSNVCAAYKKEIFTVLNGFTSHTIFNEDMIYAGRAVKAGYGIAYCASARVVHSHNYSCMQQFHRNFDLAVSQAQHPEVFGGIRSESEGIRLVKKTAEYLKEQKKLYLLPQLVMTSGFKYLGYRLGKSYCRLPKRMVLACTMNREFWTRNEMNE